MLGTFVAIVFLLGFALVLVKSTEVLTGSLKRLAQMTQLGQFGITAFVLAFATSLPELFVGVIAAFEGEPAISLGNILGSNIADLSLVIGGAAVVGSGMRVVGEFLRRDLFLSFLAGSLPLLMLVESRLSRFDGVVLCVVYVVYVVTVLKEKSGSMAEHVAVEPAFKRLFSLLHKRSAERHMVRFAVGVALLLLSSHMIVQLAEMIAVGLGLPLLLVGLFLVAIGTSLPELVFEIRAVKEGHVGMAFGDLLGSVVANSTLIMGIVALIAPFRLDGGLQPFLLGSLGFVGIFLLFWFFASTKRRLERWEGAVLLLGYLLLAVVEFLRV